MPNLSKELLFCIPALIALGSSASADNICDAVLSSRSFDVFETRTMDSIAQRATDDICSEKWKTRDDFVNRVRKWDSGFNYIDIFKGTGNADLSSQGRTVDQDYEQFCQRADKLGLRNFFTETRNQIASTAVNAWEECIKATQQVGLFSRAIIAEDRSVVTVAVRFKPNGVHDKLILKGYDEKQFSCLLNGRDVKDRDIQAEGLGNAFDLSCQPKNRESETHVAVNTSQDQTIGPFVIPSKSYLELQNLVLRMTSRVDSLSNSLAASNKKIDELQVTADGTEEAKHFVQGDIWNGDNVSTIKAACTGRNSVLVSMEFENLSVYGIRVPVGVRYVCRQLRP